MIYTSYYAKYRGNAACCISVTHPNGFKGATCEALYPAKSLVAWFKIKLEALNNWHERHKDKTEEFIKRRKVLEHEFEQSYRTDVLNRLDPQSVAKNLEGKVLMCWEKSGTFCHRYIVSQWLIENGHKCEEWL